MIALIDAIWQISSITTFVVLISLFVEITLKIKSNENFGKMFIDGITGLVSIIVLSDHVQDFVRYIRNTVLILTFLIVVSEFFGMQSIVDLLVLFETNVIIAIMLSTILCSLVASILLTINEVICLSVDGDCISGRVYFISHATFLLIIIPICIFITRIFIKY